MEFGVTPVTAGGPVAVTIFTSEKAQVPERITNIGFVLPVTIFLNSKLFPKKVSPAGAVPTFSIQPIYLPNMVSSGLDLLVGSTPDPEIYNSTFAFGWSGVTTSEYASNSIK